VRHAYPCEILPKKIDRNGNTFEGPQKSRPVDNEAGSVRMLALKKGTETNSVDLGEPPTR
jgi:hypothetical protein